MLSTLTSPNTYRVTDCISFNNPRADILSSIKNAEGIKELDFRISNQENRTFKVFGKKVLPVYKAVGIFKAVFLSPRDIDLVYGSPSLRRRFIDRVISQDDPVYLFNLREYKHILKQRNALLKKISLSKQKSSISAWDEELARKAIEIRKKRHHFVEVLNSFLIPFYKSLNKQSEEIHISYKLSPPEKIQNHAEYLNALNEKKEEDIKYITTHIGPQRDDFIFSVNDRPVSYFGSFGQVRLFVILLKLSAWAYLKHIGGDPPVILLDDILVELDPLRRTELLDLIKHLNAEQIFLATTEEDPSIKPDKSFKIDKDKHDIPIVV